MPRLTHLVVAALLFAPGSSAQGPAPRIVVVAGEDAMNIVQQKTAVAPIVEVRDRNDQPPATVTVINAFSFSGSLNGGTISGTITYSESSQGSRGGVNGGSDSIIAGGGSTTMTVTLR